MFIILKVAILPLDKHGRHFSPGESALNCRTFLNGINIILKHGSIEDMFCDATITAIRDDYTIPQGISSRMIRKGSIFTYMAF